MSTADRVFLARHGRTALNAEGRLRGLSDPPLDDVGLAEAAGWPRRWHPSIPGWWCAARCSVPSPRRMRSVRPPTRRWPSIFGSMTAITGP